MLHCDRCHEDVYHSCTDDGEKRAETRRARADDDGCGWLCSWGKKTKADNVEFGVENAIYKRRPTIQFQLTPENLEAIIVKKPASKQNSILKPLKSVQEEKCGLIIPPSRSSLKLLLVFPTIDATADAIKRAAEKLAFDITTAVTYDSALEEFQATHHDLIIVDSRQPKALDYDTLCRSIRNTKGCQHIVVVSVVKKSSFEKDDVLIMSQLDSGFNRCVVESINIITWINELIQLKNGDCRNYAQMATSQILYAAINSAKDPIIVTDDIGRLQFLNGACERLLGFRQDETLGRNIVDQLAYDTVQVNAILTQLAKGKAWQGMLVFKRKLLETINTTCRALPIICTGRLPTHFLIIIDTPAPMEGGHQLAQSRGSIHSLRKTSIDFKTTGNDYFRRTSLAKLPLEAPITKIIGLICDVQSMQSSNPQAALLLDKVIEMLKCTELYSPTVKEEAKGLTEEPVASDLIGALLSNNKISTHNINSRRSSNDSSIFRVSKSNLRVKSSSISSQMDNLLDTCLDWDFDIFRLEKLSDRRPLFFLGKQLFMKFDVASTLLVEEQVLLTWLLKVEAAYHSDNAYHNSTHAADVMQAIAGFLDRGRMKSIMDPMEEATALIAAAAHDIDHPGKSSAFLSNSDSPLAILYNDITVLESHHAALTFKLTLGDDKCNIFKNLDKDSYKIARYNVIDMILATEMTKHFEHLAKFVNVFCNSKEMDGNFTDFDAVSQPENVALVKRIMIKCADVSNPTRPLNVCVEWARRIAEEYFAQTDEEKDKGLPVVMPMFDRTSCSIPKSQVGFVDFIINDMIEAWNAFIDMPDLVVNMRLNYNKWREYDEKGFCTTSEIQKLQETTAECSLNL